MPELVEVVEGFRIEVAMLVVPVFLLKLLHQLPGIGDVRLLCADGGVVLKVARLVAAYQVTVIMGDVVRC